MKTMRATALTLAVVIGAWLSTAAGHSLHAQQLTQSVLPPGTQSQPGAPPPPPMASTPPPLTNPPNRLMAVQQLALAAYPELRNRGLQIRVQETATGETITFGFVEKDRTTILAVSRPREAQIVVEAVFDTNDGLHTALLRGMLAHTIQRRQMKTVTTGLAAALAADGAAFGPDKSASLVQQLNLNALQPILGTLTIGTPVFTQDASDDGLFWQVGATTATGQPVTLGFEPYLGRLVRLTR